MADAAVSRQFVGDSVVGEPLCGVLERNGYSWNTTRFDDGRFEILIREKRVPG